METNSRQERPKGKRAKSEEVVEQTAVMLPEPDEAATGPEEALLEEAKEGVRPVVEAPEVVEKEIGAEAEVPEPVEKKVTVSETEHEAVSPAGQPQRNGNMLQQLMAVPSFRKLVVSRLVRKLR